MKEKTDNIDILEELKKWFNNFDLDSIKHKPEEYIQAISNLIAENKELKEKNKKLQKYMEEYLIPKSTINLVYIPKSKVEEKIEEIEKKFKEETNPNILVTLKILKDALQSLLGKE